MSRSLSSRVLSLSFLLLLASAVRLAAVIVENPEPASVGDPVTLRVDGATGEVLPEGVPMPVSLILDDGTGEILIGDAGQFVWLNRFTPAAGEFPFDLERVEVVFGTTAVVIGGAVEIVIHQDVDGDGDPGTGALHAASYAGVVQAADNVTWNVYDLVPPVRLNGPGDVLVGVVNRYGSEGLNDFPAGLDQTASQGRSWAGSYLAGNAPVPPFYPADEQWGTIDSFGVPGNWMIRASGTTVPPPLIVEIPTASTVGLLLLGIALAAAAFVALRRA